MTTGEINSLGSGEVEFTPGRSIVHFGSPVPQRRAATRKMKAGARIRTALKVLAHGGV